MYINYKHRIFGLDVIRALAILMVLGSHSSFLLFKETSSLSLTVIRFFGTIGVDLFFVLSGFLIGGIILKQLEEERTKFKDFLNFWIRRWLRTLPLYFLILLLNVILFYFLHERILDNTVSYIFFLQNFSNPHPDFFTEAWSLSVEEYAYIFGPLLLLLLINVTNNTSKKKLYMVTIFIIIGLIISFRWLFDFNNDIHSMIEWSQNIRKVVIYRIDSIYYGFLGAYFAKYFNSIWYHYRKLFFILACFLFFGIHVIIFRYDVNPKNASVFYNLFYLPLISISLLLFFPVFSNWKKGTILKRQITMISVLSYGLYLLNYSLVLLTIEYYINMEMASLKIKLLVFFIYWGVSFFGSFLLYKYFEKPILEWRDSKFIKTLFEKS